MIRPPRSWKEAMNTTTGTPAEVLRASMVDHVVNASYARSGPVEEALREVPRHRYLPATTVEDAYADIVVITKRASDGAALSCASVPTVVAMLDQLDVRLGDRILEIGRPETARAGERDPYGHARLPASAHDAAPQRIDKIPYGRFRNVYLYITERCQLRCEHCYMGERLDRALRMPFDEIGRTLTTWRQMGGSKLTVLGGEPTLHPDFIEVIRYAKTLGYEHVITTSNGLQPAIRRFRRMTADDFAYIQISLDGGSADSHDQVRGKGTFDEALRNVAELVEQGFDTRIICTVNRVNASDALRLLDIADDIGVSLVKFHVFSVIGNGHGAAEWGMQPAEWIAFYERLERAAPGHRTRVWYQPTYARPERIAGYAAAGYRGCIGRTLDRISIFPTAGPTSARSCSTPTCTSPPWPTDRWSSTAATTSSTCSLACWARPAAATAKPRAPAWAAAQPKNSSWDRPPALLSPTSCRSAGYGRPTSPPGDPESPDCDGIPPSLD